MFAGNCRIATHESGNLLSVLDELHTDTLSDSRVWLLGLDSDLHDFDEIVSACCDPRFPESFAPDLLNDDTLCVGRSTGGGRAVRCSEGTLLVVQVCPSVVSAVADELARGVKTSTVVIERYTYVSA